MASTAVSEALKRATRSNANRSLSISVSPAPVRFAERRSVLQVLEKYGQVEFFKAVPAHDSMFLSLMKDDEDASKVIRLSPISFKVSQPRSSRQSLSKPQPVTKIKPGGSSGSSDALSDNTETNANSESLDKEFRVYIYPHPTYRHHESFDTKLHLAWPDFACDDNSFLSKTLKPSLPNTMAAKGLANWEPDFGKQRLGSPATIKKEERLQTASWIPSKMQDQVRRREEARDQKIAEKSASDETLPNKIDSNPNSSG